MKRLFTFCFILLAAISVRAEGIEFFHGSWDDALKEAEKRGVVIFVDAYTTWCGPCKRMAAQIFPLKDVGDFYNPNFVNVKMDMESEAGMAFRRKYTVSAYPTLLYIAPDGELVLSAVGAKPVDKFLALGREAVSKYDGSAKYKVKYEEGDHTYETVYSLVEALNKSDKSSLRVANDYLKEQADLSTEENLRLILEAFTQVDSKIYEYLQEYQKDIVKLVGEDAVHQRMRAAAAKTAERAVEYESEMLLKEAIMAMEKHLPKEADMFTTSVTMDYAAATGDAETYLKYAKQYIKQNSGDDASRLHEMANTIMKEFYRNEELLKIGEKAAKMSVDLQDNANHNITYATLIYLQGDKRRAISEIDNAIKRLKEDDKERAVEKLEELKKKMGVS